MAALFILSPHLPSLGREELRKWVRGASLAVSAALSSLSRPDGLTDGGAGQISARRPDRTLAHPETPLVFSLVFADMSGIVGRRRTPCWTRLTATKTHLCYQRQQIRLAELF